MRKTIHERSAAELGKCQVEKLNFQCWFPKFSRATVNLLCFQQWPKKNRSLLCKSIRQYIWFSACMTELQHNKQIILWVSARHSVWKTPKQGQSQVPKPVARDGASSVATCWAAAIINACAGLWMEHRRNQRNAKCKKKWFKGWPHFGVQILDPKMGTRKEKMKAWPHFGVQNLDPKMGSATRVDLPAFVVWISPAAYAWTF